MKFDVVIIGGGLSGLICGIRLSKGGKKCVIVSSGQSAMHFSSGSFDLLNALPDGERVYNPIEDLPKLIEQNPLHPYSKIGKDKFESLAVEAKEILQEANICTNGSCEKNKYRITPLAKVKPTWLTIDDYFCMDEPNNLSWKSVAIFNFVGYLDFYPQFLFEEFNRRGISAEIFDVDLASVEVMRRNPSELRSTNIARLLDEKETQENLIRIIKERITDEDAILLPACLGLENNNAISNIRQSIKKIVQVIATFPPSVGGIRVQNLLKRRFLELGGMYMLGDNVNKVEFLNNNVEKVFTVNHGDIPLTGDDFVLSSGSFFSQGLVALPDNIIDPIFDLDIDCSPNRLSWYSENVYDKQKYQSFGVKTDKNFLAIRKNKVVENLYACGAVLGGFDALKEGCGSGVSMLTALNVAEKILNK